MRYRSLLALLLLTITPALAQPPEPLPLDQRPRTRGAVIGWIQEQAREGDLRCTVTLNDGSVLRGELETLHGGPNVPLRTRLADQPLQVPLDMVVRIEFRGLVPLPLLPSAKIQFRDGSWVLGAEITALDQNSLRFSTPYANDLEAPVGAVAELQLAEVAPDEAAQEQVLILRGNALELRGNAFEVVGGQRLMVEGQPLVAERPLLPAPLQAPPPAPNLGRIWLTNGDVMSGQLISVAAGSLTFRLQLGPEIQVPFGEVMRITLGSQALGWQGRPPLPAASPDKRSARVMLITGEVWSGTIEGLDAQGLRLGWLGGQNVLLPCGLLHALTDLEQGIPGLRQWAVGATASSEYGNPAWGAVQATGPPNTLQDGDSQAAWATTEQDGGPEWLELEYTTPVHATCVRVRETYNPGAVVRIEGVAEGGEVLTLWEGRDPTQQSPGWLEARFDPTPASLKKIRVHLDTALVPGWNEIDAVELVGTP